MLIWTLRILFLVIFIAIVGINIRAVSMESLFQIPPFVAHDPWFTSTLVDAYCGFLTFYAWVAYKSHSVFVRILWFVVIMLTGNIGISAYMLVLLFRLSPGANAADILLSSSDRTKLAS